MKGHRLVGATVLWAAPVAIGMALAQIPSAQWSPSSEAANPQTLSRTGAGRPEGVTRIAQKQIIQQLPRSANPETGSFDPTKRGAAGRNVMRPQTGSGRVALPESLGRVRVSRDTRSVTLSWPDTRTHRRKYVVSRRLRPYDDRWLELCRWELQSRTSAGNGDMLRCTDEPLVPGRPYHYRIEYLEYEDQGSGQTIERRISPSDTLDDAKPQAPPPPVDRIRVQNAKRIETRTRAVAPENRCVRNVPRAFAAIPGKVGGKKHNLAANRFDGLPPRRYVNLPVGGNPENWGKEHFQGVQRLDRYLIMSGGVYYGNPHRSQLIVIQMGTRQPFGPWSVPEYPFPRKKPHPLDRIIRVIDVDPTLWHAGGIQLMGHVLAVPVYGDGKGSEIRFYDFSDPLAPRPLPNLTVARGNKSYAVALTRMPNRHYGLLVWNDRDFYFYYSQSTDIRNGFIASRARYYGQNVRGGLSVGGCPKYLKKINKCPTYQNINFINDCNGDVYLAAFRNTNRLPFLPGGDWAALYRVRFSDDFQRVTDMRLVDTKHMYCYRKQCNFGSGAGIYVSPSNNAYIYGIYHFLLPDVTSDLIDCDGLDWNPLDWGTCFLPSLNEVINARKTLDGEQTWRIGFNEYVRLNISDHR